MMKINPAAIKSMGQRRRICVPVGALEIASTWLRAVTSGSDEKPFCKVKTQKSSVKVNEFVPREIVDKLIKSANPVWQVILGVSRYGGLRTPSEMLSLRWYDIDWGLNRISIQEPKVEHHEGRGIRSCPIFPELRPILDEAFEIFGDKSEYVVAAPKYRAAANTAMGWKYANLRSEMTRLLHRAGVSGWPRL
ncbi:MAG: Tyrosine recombinase XerC, partial [Planctomycetota bacterium]